MNTRADSLVLANESPEAWDRHLADHIRRYRPTSDLERVMVEDIAFCRWRPIRMRTIDTALWDIRMEEQSRDLVDTYRSPTEPVRLTHAFSSDDSSNRSGATKLTCAARTTAPFATSSISAPGMRN